ncbi:hypothetical protein [Streptomyces sp. NPDC002580]|uniref:hypothetical protein n=1 Tax=Streptomyces sp. NPDC002580 TaxID=3364653 RepID=UPI00368CC761
MPTGILTIKTPSRTVRGCLYVTGTHHPSDWDQFTALRVSLGSVDVMGAIAPADSLPGQPAAQLDGLPRLGASVGAVPLESVSGRAPSPKIRQTLALVLRACAEQVAHRPDLPRLLDAARTRETPGLLRFLTWSVRHSEAAAEQYEREAVAYRRDARAAVTAWWTAARWLAADWHPVTAVLLMSYRGFSRTPRRLPARLGGARRMGWA